MQKRYKNMLLAICVAIVFFTRLKQGLFQPANTPGFIPSGAMNEPLMVLISALFLSGLTWALLEVLFWVFAKIKNLRS